MGSVVHRAGQRLLTSGSLKVAWPDAQARLGPSRETISQEHSLESSPGIRHWREALTRYTELGAPEAEQVHAELARDAAQV